MTDGKSYLFIVNPVAGRRNARDSEKAISSFSRSKRMVFEIRLTGSSGDAGRIASDGVREGFSHIVSVGGDGTSSDIANAIAGSNVKFGIVAGGSGNDFPAACGVPVSTAEALETVFSGKCMKVDMGLLDGRGFINGLGIGMDGAIASVFPRFRFLGGFFGYLASAGATAFGFEGFPVRLSSSSVEVEGRCLLTGVSNGAGQGGFKISPAARPNDGLLDFHFISDMSFFMRIARLVSVMGGAAQGGWMRRFQSRCATVETERDLPAHMDGEPFVLKAGCHNVSTDAGALNVLTPSGILSA